MATIRMREEFDEAMENGRGLYSPDNGLYVYAWEEEPGLCVQPIPLDVALDFCEQMREDVNVDWDDLVDDYDVWGYQSYEDEALDEWYSEFVNGNDVWYDILDEELYETLQGIV